MQNLEKFYQLDEEKRNRIFQAAIEEFSKGYRVASTNKIVEKAQISKGLLFHYFGSKKGLALALCTHLLDAIWTEESIREVLAEPDAIVRLNLMANHEIEIVLQYPSFLAFFQKMLEEKILTTESMISFENIKSFMAQTFANIDRTLFKEGLDIDKTLSMMRAMIEKLTQEKTAELIERKKEINQEELEDIVSDFTEYTKYFRDIFYR